MQQEYTATVKKLEKHVFHSNQETTDDSELERKYLKKSGVACTQKMINYHYNILISIL